MALTSEEIAGKEFLVGLRGYDKNEVRGFLRTVATEFAEAGERPADTADADDADAAAEPVVQEAEPAVAPSTGASDWSNLGEEIAAVLRTAHEQAAALRADAERQAEEVRSQAATETERLSGEASQRAETLVSEADEYAQRIRAEAEERVQTAQADAEQQRHEAGQALAVAQDEALALVGEAQERVSRLEAESKERSQQAAQASVSAVTEQLDALKTTRAGARDTLQSVRQHIDEALVAAERDPDPEEAMEEAPVPTDA